MEQRTAIDLALQGHNIFLTGKAGTGKTYTLNKIIEAIRDTGKIVAVTASTGIASTHLNGTTIHSWSGIGIKKKLEIDDLFKLKNNKFSFDRIYFADVLIIDEISMFHDYLFDLVEEVCKFIKNRNKIFGGLQVIISGDFFQLPPVEKNNVKNYCFHSAAWKGLDFKICYLEKIYRQENDKQFIDILNNIRRNKVTNEQREILHSLSENTKYYEKGVNLYCKNVNVDIENSVQLNKIQSESFISKMTSNGLDFKVQQMKNNCLAPDSLILKEGAKVMILVNENRDMLYCNGTLCEVEDLSDFDKGTVVLRKLKDNTEIAIGKYTWEMKEYNHDRGCDVTIATITQYPLKLAWALTVHKSQGATFDFVNLNLHDTFVENMGYVALSRVTTLDGLYLAGFNDIALHIDNYIIEKDKEFYEASKEVEKELELTL